MNNTVLVESKLRRILKLACTLLCVFCLCSIAVLVCVTMIGNKNLSGQVKEVTGTLDKVYETDSNVLTLNDGNEYNVVWSSDIGVDMNNYKGKTITLVVTQETFANANAWVLGLVVDGKTIVDYHDTLNYQTESNNEMKTVVVIITAVLCAVTCGVFIWRFNVKPAVERPLYREYSEFLTYRQPVCRERKLLIVYCCVYIGLLVALLIAGIIADPDSETYAEMTNAARVIMWMFVAIGVTGMAGLFVFMRWILHREIDFYADNLPFDFSDIPAATLNKKVREELQEKLRKERMENPDLYADGGNGYDILFGEDGVTLKEPYDYEDPQVNFDVVPDVNDVFGNGATLLVSKTNNGEGNIDSVVDKNALRFTYKEMNFEAVAHFRKTRQPMMIIIKSRLNRTTDFPEEFVNDIHIALDINLLKTLQKYHVEVENLDYLLANKKQLMLENCLKIGKK